MASSAMEFQLGVFGFLPTAHAKTNANKMCPWSSCAVLHFTCVYFHAQTAVYMYLTNHDYVDREKKANTSNARIKVAQVPGSPVYICGFLPSNFSGWLKMYINVCVFFCFFLIFIQFFVLYVFVFRCWYLLEARKTRNQEHLTLSQMVTKVTATQAGKNSHNSGVGCSTRKTCMITLRWSQTVVCICLEVPYWNHGVTSVSVVNSVGLIIRI